MTRCFLAEDVYVCYPEDSAVFLDLSKNKYIGIPREQVGTLKLLLSSADTEPGTSSTSSTLLSTLTEAGLLSLHSPPMTISSGADLAAATIPLIDLDPDSFAMEAGAVRMQDVRYLLRAYILGSVMWRWRSVKQAIHRVQRRKVAAMSNGHSVDVEQARRVMRVFNYLRPFVYAARRRCLLDTLTLLEFLAMYDIYPTWVFGVQARPFEAHTWVQSGDFVFNDHPSRTLAFTPILAI